MAAQGKFADAATQLAEAARLSQMREPVILQMLAAMFAETRRYPEAVEIARRALALAAEQRNQELEAALRSDLDRYQALAH